ncbi:TPA: amino acid ABC transporter permease [Streptococcus suis]|nr:amino acid ABC transporter permease [Streptococcus suis]HEM5234651.1 amino acid ABC transporter permease [Streptococcus suis]HEM5241721.1 amino acid ABC transporter permease [Streptococcus suis]
MKRLNHFCMILLLCCVSFIVVNLHYTKEINRIRELGTTDYSFQFYLRDSAVPSQDLLHFFEKIADKYDVSIVKTDSNTEVIKAGVFSHETFPYKDFGIQQLTFNEDGSGSYTNIQSSDKLGHIPTFLQAKTIRLITLKNYFQDTSHTLNGQYTVTSTKSINDTEIVQELSHFFNIDSSTLLTPTFETAVELINRDLLLVALICCIAFLLLSLTSVYQPILDIKHIGVEKILGYSNLEIFYRYVKQNILIMGIGSIILNSLPFLFFDYIPQGFSAMMLLAHFILLQLYLLINILVITIIQRINAASIIKGFVSFKTGFYINNFFKCCLTLLITILMIGVGNSMYEEHQELNYQEQWEKQGDFLTLETVKSGNQLWQDSLSGSDKAHQYYYSLYKNLTENLPTYYIRSSIINPGNFSHLKEFEHSTLANDIPVLYANKSYLESIGFPIPHTSKQLTVLFPASMKENEESDKNLAKLIGLLSLKYEEQVIKTISEVDVECIYYESDWTFFPYNETLSNNFTNPIISLVNDNDMSWEDKAHLSNTGLSSPIKIANTPQNQQKIEQILQKLPDDSYFKFSSIKSIQQGRVDSFRDASRNFITLFAIICLLSIVVSYFIVKSMFLWRKSHIFTMKFLGWSLLDRYKPILIGLALLYLLPLPVILIAGKSLFPLVLFLLFAIADGGIFLFTSLSMEQKNLVQYLKGENL